MQTNHQVNMIRHDRTGIDGQSRIRNNLFEPFGNDESLIAGQLHGRKFQMLFGFEPFLIIVCVMGATVTGVDFGCTAKNV